MCLLLETIKVADGVFTNLAYHEKRFNEARKNLFNASPISLHDSLRLPPEAQHGIFRCRILYKQAIEKVEFIPFQIRKIESFRLVHADEIDYSYKYANRKELQKLYEQRGNCDEIIIVKRGLITDTFTGNLVFFNGKKWLTPDQPLLKGTQRQFLLDTHQIFEAPFRESDLKNAEKIGMINTFYDLKSMPVVKNIAIKN